MAMGILMPAWGTMWTCLLRCCWMAILSSPTTTLKLPVGVWAPYCFVHLAKAIVLCQLLAHQ